MNDAPGPAEMEVAEARPSLLRRVSVAWLVPLIALAVVLGVAYQNYLNRGVLIEITFDQADGITADETVIKYRDVQVGQVEDVRFDAGLGDVLVEARIDQDIAPYLDDDARFWVVQPDVSLRGITGLETVLSGVFIEGTWDTEADEAQTRFAGLNSPPIARAGQRGVEITLRARDASALSAGAPVLHKGIQVGYLEEPRLSLGGTTVTVGAFIEAPYDRRITSNTRFWDASGFSLNVGASGLEVDFGSIASLIEGGIAFDTVVSGGLPVRAGDTFDIFEDEVTARTSLFAEPDRPTLDVAALFDGTVSGLSAGSEVRFRGIRVGQVKEISAIVVDESTAPQVDLRAVLALEPGRMGLGADATPADALGFLTAFVADGLRARLVTGNLLSGTLTVELLVVENAPRATMDPAADPYPLIPVTESSITDVADTADSVLQRINNLPIEELLQSAIDLMESVTALAQSEDVTTAPAALTALLDETRALIASDDLQAIPADVRGVIDDVDTLVGEFAAAGLAARLATALDGAQMALDNIAAGTEGLPELTAEAQVLIAKLNALEIEALVAQTSTTLDTVNTLFASAEAAALPGNLNALLVEAEVTLASARGILDSPDTLAIPGELRGTIASLNGIVADLAEADLAAGLTAAIDSAASAAANADAALAGLPAITAELEALLAKANALELKALVDAASETLGSIDTLVGADSTQALPAALSAALDEVRAFLTEVSDGGAVANVNAALAAANTAAQAIEEAARSLPALSAQTSALAAEARSTLDSYGDRSRFNAETLATLRDIQAAADAVSSLARAIQRNPNSLLTGR